VDGVVIDGRAIGDGAPCFIIAEAGVNHHGSVTQAHALVDAAAEAGADAVKFQTFIPSLLASAAAQKAPYQAASTGAEGSQLEMLEALTLPTDALSALAAHAARRGLIFLSTPFDVPSAELLNGLGMAAFKVPSGELTNHGFLEYLSGWGKPLLISTGMSTLQEVEAACSCVRRAGGPPMALLHCVSSYPADASDCNLRALETLRTTFDVPVGFSDHTMGTAISLAAVARGADVLEKHFTLDRTLPGPDHMASLEPDDLRQLVSSVRAVEAALGDGVKRPVAAELATAVAARRSMHTARSLVAGHILTADDLVALRPGTGISPAAVDKLLGRRTCIPLPAGAMLHEEQLR
jgi:N,N'-diacetyllegionaminate synthase